MGEVNAVLKEETIEFQGAKYVLHRPTFDVEAMYESWLEERALEKVNRRRMKMGEEAYRIAISAWQKDCAAGEYAWGSATMEKSRLNTPCFKHLLFLMFCEANTGDGGKPRMTKELFNAIYAAKEQECIDAWYRILFQTPTMPPQEAGESDSALSKSVPS